MDDGKRMLIGTSGWSYNHWDGVFYPDEVSADERLAYYATRFDTVEVNNTFYHLPTEHAVQGWHDTVPPDFRFAVKGSRLVTHYHRLKNIDDAVTNFMERMSHLGETLSVVLWQLPPQLDADPGLLDGFLGRLDTPGVRHAVEFRNEHWLSEETFAVLRAHNAAHVNVASERMPRNFTVTADFAYVRFHGTDTYHGAYAKPALEPWAEFLGEQIRGQRGGYVYFNNDAEGHAPKDAARLAQMLGVELPSAAASGATAR